MAPNRTMSTLLLFLTLTSAVPLPVAQVGFSSPGGAAQGPKGSQELAETARIMAALSKNLNLPDGPGGDPTILPPPPPKSKSKAAAAAPANASAPAPSPAAPEKRQFDLSGVPILGTFLGLDKKKDKDGNAMKTIKEGEKKKTTSKDKSATSPNSKDKPASAPKQKSAAAGTKSSSSPLGGVLGKEKRGGGLLGGLPLLGSLLGGGKSKRGGSGLLGGLPVVGDLLGKREVGGLTEGLPLIGDLVGKEKRGGGLLGGLPLLGSLLGGRKSKRGGSGLLGGLPVVGDLLGRGVPIADAAVKNAESMLKEDPEWSTISEKVDGEVKGATQGLPARKRQETNPDDGSSDIVDDDLLPPPENAEPINVVDSKRKRSVPMAAAAVKNAEAMLKEDPEWSTTSEKVDGEVKGATQGLPARKRQEDYEDDSIDVREKTKRDLFEQTSSASPLLERHNAVLETLMWKRFTVDDYQPGDSEIESLARSAAGNGNIDESLKRLATGGVLNGEEAAAAAERMWEHWFSGVWGKLAKRTMALQKLTHLVPGLIGREE